jgi:hypothetical protein
MIIGSVETKNFLINAVDAGVSNADLKLLMYILLSFSSKHKPCPQVIARDLNLARPNVAAALKRLNTYVERVSYGKGYGYCIRQDIVEDWSKCIVARHIDDPKCIVAIHDVYSGDTLNNKERINKEREENFSVVCDGGAKTLEEGASTSQKETPVQIKKIEEKTPPPPPAPAAAAHKVFPDCPADYLWCRDIFDKYFVPTHQTKRHQAVVDMQTEIYDHWRAVGWTNAAIAKWVDAMSWAEFVNRYSSRICPPEAHRSIIASSWIDTIAEVNSVNLDSFCPKLDGYYEEDDKWLDKDWTPRSQKNHRSDYYRPRRGEEGDNND